MIDTKRMRRSAALLLDGAGNREEAAEQLEAAAAEIDRQRALKQPAVPTRDEIIKLWGVSVLETATGLDAMEYFTRAILEPNG